MILHCFLCWCFLRSFSEATVADDQPETRQLDIFQPNGDFKGRLQLNKNRFRGNPGDCNIASDVDGTFPCRNHFSKELNDGIGRPETESGGNQLTILVYLGMSPNRRSKSHVITLLLTQFFNSTMKNATFQMPMTKFGERVEMDLQPSLMERIEWLRLAAEEKRSSSSRPVEGEGEYIEHDVDEKPDGESDDCVGELCGTPGDKEEEPVVLANSGGNGRLSGRMPQKSESGKDGPPHGGSLETAQVMPDPKRFRIFHVNTETTSLNQLKGVPTEIQLWQYAITFAAYYDDNTPVPDAAITEDLVTVMTECIDTIRVEIGAVLVELLDEPWILFATDMSIMDTDWEFWNSTTSQDDGEFWNSTTSQDDHDGDDAEGYREPKPPSQSAPAPSPTIQSYRYPLDSDDWGLQRYSGLALVVFSLGMTVVLAVWSSCRHTRLKQRSAWGNLTTENGVDELLEMGWVLKDGKFIVFDKAGVGYCDEDSVFRGGFQQRESIVGAEISVTLPESENSPDSQSFRMMSFTEKESVSIPDSLSLQS